MDEGNHQTYADAEGVDPTPQRNRIRMLIIVRRRGDTHEPFMRDRPDRFEFVPLRKKQVAGTGKLADRGGGSSSRAPDPVCQVRVLLTDRLGSPDETLDDQVLGVKVPAPAGGKLGKDTAGPEERQALLLGLFELSVMGPVGVDEAGVGFGDEVENRYLVQDRFHPQPFRLDRDAAELGIVAGRDIWRPVRMADRKWSKFDLHLLARAETEPSEKA